MSNMREMMCFHSNLTVKMYFEFEFFPCWLQFSLSIFQEPHPLHIQIYFLLGSGEITRMILKISKNAEFRGSAELLHVCSHRL